MTFEQFMQTAQPITDQAWEFVLREKISYGVSRENFVEYGAGEQFILYESAGLYYPLQWVYPPTPIPTLRQAVLSLYEWRKEFQ